MLVASPFRAIAGSLLVSMLFAPRAEPESVRERAALAHTLATQEKELGDPLGPAVPWAEVLPPILVQCANTRAEAEIRLYRSDGQLDPEAADTFAQTVSEKDDVPELNLRTVQLVFKAAYHFKSKKIEIVSAYRRGRGPHASGDALDFRLAGVGAGALAAYLRTLPRAGVGVYTNPRTLYVHVDAREQSFHWLDASPPGKTWREAPLADGKRDERDAAWSPANDLPTDVLKK